MKFKAFWILSSCILRKCYLICQIILLVLLNCFENLLKVLHIQNVQKKVVKYPVTNSPQQFFKGLLYKALNSAGLIFANFPPFSKIISTKCFFKGGEEFAKSYNIIIRKNLQITTAHFSILKISQNLYINDHYFPKIFFLPKINSHKNLFASGILPMSWWQ